MGKVVSVIFSDKVNKYINIGTFLTLLTALATLMFNYFSLKSEIDISINSLEKADIRIEQKFDNSVYELQMTDEEIIIEQKEDRAVVLEVRTGIAGIQTDLKWIISNME